MVGHTLSYPAGIAFQTSLGDIAETALGAAFGTITTLVTVAFILGVGFALGRWIDDTVYRWAWRHRFDEHAAETPAGAVFDGEDAVSTTAGGLARTLVYVVAAIVAVSMFDVRQVESLSTVVIGYVPNVVAAAVLLVAGFAVGRVARRVIAALVADTSVGAAFPETHLGHLVGAEAGTLASLAGAAAEYYAYLVTIYIVASVLSLAPVAGLLGSAVFYAPVLASAGAVVVLGSLVANYASTVATDTEPVADSPFAAIVGGGVEAVVYIFTAVIALNVAGVDSLVLGLLLLAVVFPVGLAAALAFGLGGQDHVDEWLGSQRSGRSSSTAPADD